MDSTPHSAQSLPCPPLSGEIESWIDEFVAGDAGDVVAPKARPTFSEPEENWSTSTQERAAVAVWRQLAGAQQALTGVEREGRRVAVELCSRYAIPGQVPELVVTETEHGERAASLRGQRTCSSSWCPMCSRRLAHARAARAQVACERWLDYGENGLDDDELRRPALYHVTLTMAHGVGRLDRHGDSIVTLAQQRQAIADGWNALMRGRRGRLMRERLRKHRIEISSVLRGYEVTVPGPDDEAGKLGHVHLHLLWMVLEDGGRLSVSEVEALRAAVTDEWRRALGRDALVHERHGVDVSRVRSDEAAAVARYAASGGLIDDEEHSRSLRPVAWETAGGSRGKQARSGRWSLPQLFEGLASGDADTVEHARRWYRRCVVEMHGIRWLSMGKGARALLPGDGSDAAVRAWLEERHGAPEEPEIVVEHVLRVHDDVLAVIGAVGELVEAWICERVSVETLRWRADPAWDTPFAMPSRAGPAPPVVVV